MTFLTYRGEGPGFRYAGQPVHILAGDSGRPAGFAAMEITIPGHFAGPVPHAHDEFDEAIYVLSGRLLVAGDHEPQETAPGSMFVAPRGHRHGFSNPFDEEALVLGLWAPPAPPLPSCKTSAQPLPPTPCPTRTACATFTPGTLVVSCPDSLSTRRWQRHKHDLRWPSRILPHRPQDLWHYDGRADLGNMACCLLYMEVPMAIRPHDVADLYLAPVVLAVDARIEKLGRLDKDGLAYEVALESDSPDFTRRIREDGLIRTVTHLIDCHGWEFSWDPRGLRLTHDAHTFVLGIPAVFLEYLEDSPGV
jgi:mannose-6-phosphate isomerase-like protein (cupin superfamily)